MFFYNRFVRYSYTFLDTTYNKLHVILFIIRQYYLPIIIVIHKINCEVPSNNDRRIQRTFLIKFFSQPYNHL